jgi:hypothetical protein
VRPNAASDWGHYETTYAGKLAPLTALVTLAYPTALALSKPLSPLNNWATALANGGIIVL